MSSICTPFPPREVKPVVEKYLEEAHRLGFRALRIIHGRGIGVQREMVRSILAQDPFCGKLFRRAAEAGGWGATVVTLRVGTSHPEMWNFSAARGESLSMADADRR